MDGVLVCDKPAGTTSHDVVAKVRRLAHQRRVGHGGTLDPPATGVLVVALGRATRLLPFLPMEPKRYLAGIAFGAETDTLDASGVTTGTAPVDGIDEAAVARGLERFLGPQQQVPPMVSAVKLDGERTSAGSSAAWRTWPACAARLSARSGSGRRARSPSWRRCRASPAR